MIALLHAGHARADIDDDAGALMAQDGGEQPLRVGAGKRELVGVADAGRFYLDQYFPGFRPVQIHLGDFERLGLFECDGSTGFHDDSPLPVLAGTFDEEPAGRRRQSGGGESRSLRMASH